MTENTFGMRRALAKASTIWQAASNFGHITRAITIPFLSPRLEGALSLSPRLGMASGIVADSEPTAPAISDSDRPNSSVKNETTEATKAHRHHNSSKSFRSDCSFKALLGIFSSAYHFLAVSPSRSRKTNQGNPVHRDKGDADPLANVKQSAARLLRQLAAPFALVLKRALVRGTRIINEIAEFLKNNTTVSTPTKWAVYALGALWLLGSAVKFIRSAVIEPLHEGFRLALSPVFAFRWLVSAADFGAMLAAVRLTSYFVLGGILTAIVGLAVAGYELYRHWHAAKRLLSRSINSAHKAIVHLMRWMGDTTRSAAACAGSPITSITATLPNRLHSLATAAATRRDLNGARAVERAAAGARPARLRAIRQAAAAAAFATPLMLATAPAGAFAPPLISTSDTARIAATLSTTRMTQGAIVVNYAPNVTIHSEGAADTAALKRGVLEILERHGRELHQTLTREVVRQQRRDFQPRYSHEQR